MTERQQKDEPSERELLTRIGDELGLLATAAQTMLEVQRLERGGKLAGGMQGRGGSRVKSFRQIEEDERVARAQRRANIAIAVAGATSLASLVTAVATLITVL